ncbi:hypothetical protein FQA39_LY08086 [Lamprigera yunnana]|nr:hypothetical protein FQA39_LY08086 [Lamprigera yunnana]
MEIEEVERHIFGKGKKVIKLPKKKNREERTKDGDRSNKKREERKIQWMAESMSSNLSRKHFHAQAREMAFNVYQWIKSQNEDQCTNEIKEKVSSATGVSVRTIERIIKEGSTLPKAETDKRFKSPEKKTK